MSFSKRGHVPFILFTVVLLLATVLQPVAHAAPALTVSVTGPASVTIGNNVTYTVTVTNGGTDHAASVTVTNVLTGATLVDTDPPPGGSCTALVCSFGQVNQNGGSKTLEIEVAPTAAGTDVTLTADAVTTTAGEDATNNQGSASTTVNAAAVLPDVSITKTESVDPATEGVNFTYTLTVANATSTPATNVTVTDNLPNSLTFVSAVPSSGTCNNSANVSCDLGTVSQGTPATVTVTVTPKNSAANTTISNTASVTATGETATGDNSDTEETAVSAASTGGTGGGNTGDVSIVDPANGQPFSSQNNEPHVPCVPFALDFTGFAANQALNYRVYAQNPTTPNGPATAAQLVPATPITADSTGKATSGSINLESILLNNFTRQANQGYHLTLEVDTAAPFDYAAGGGDTKSKTFWIDCFAGNIDVVKAISAGSDQTETFDFSITGPDNFSDTATLGHNQSTATTTPAQTFDPTQGGTYTIVETAETGWDAPQITCVKGANNDAVTTTSTNGGQGVSFTLLTADVTCTFTNTETPATTTDVSITKTDDEVADPVDEGENFVYTLTVTNTDSTDSAANVTVSDDLPDDVTYVSHTIDGVADSGNLCSYSAGTDTFSCSLGTMAAGDDFVIAVTVTADVDGTLNNTATVDTTSVDSNAANDSDSETTTVANVVVNTDTDVSITKADDEVADPVDEGENFVYTLTVTNTDSTDSAANVTVSDNLPDDVTYVSHTIDALPDLLNRCSYNSTTDIFGCSLGTMAAGDDFVIAVTVTADVDGTLNNTATVDTTSVDTNAANDSDSETTTVANVAAAQADLSITKDDDEVANGPFLVGDTVTYTLTATNGGPAAAQGVTISDTLPAGLQLVSATPTDTSDSCVANLVTDSLTCSHNGPLPPSGPNNVFQVSVTATAAAPGLVTNTATVDGTSPTDPNAANDTDDETTLINTDGVVDISVLKADDEAADPVDEGETFVYTMTVTNNDAHDAAAAVTLSDNLPDNVTYVSHTIDGAADTANVCSYNAGTDTFSCSLGTMAAGDDFVIAVTVTADVDGTLNNTATVGTTSTEINTANNEDSEQTIVANVPTPPSADLSITLTDDPDPVTLGNDVTFEAVITNNGPDTGCGLVVDVPIIEGFTLDLESLDLGETTEDCETGTQLLSTRSTKATRRVTQLAVGCGATLPASCNLGSLANGQSTTLTFTGTPAQLGAFTTSASISSLSPTDPNLANNQATQTTLVVGPPLVPPPPGGPSADVSITKTDSADPVAVGASYSYTLTVANAGPNAATGVTVTDTIPSGLTFVSATSSAAGVTCATALPTVTCQVGTLPAGQQVQIVIVVVPTVPGLVVNTATVSSATPDPDPSDNTDTEGTTIGSPPTGGTGTIVVEKQTVPDGESTIFTFTGDLSATLADGGQATLDVSAGTYTVTEVKDRGWSLVRVECVDSDAGGTASQGRIGSRTATFNVDAGETVHCVFTNAKDEVKGGQTDRPDREPDLVKDRVIARRGNGKVLPFTGGRALELVVLAATLMLTGLMLAARKPRGRHRVL